MKSKIFALTVGFLLIFSGVLASVGGKTNSEGRGCDDDMDLTAVDPLDPPYFDIVIDSTNSPVSEGEVLEVEVTITNTGDETGTQDVDLLIDGTVMDTTTRTIDPGNESYVSLSWNTDTGAAGAYTANVSSEDDSDTTDVRVMEPPYFDVGIDSTNSPVVEGETLEVDTTITNTGGETGTVDVELIVDGVKRDSVTIIIAPGTEAVETLSWNTEVGDRGSYIAEVSSGNDTDSMAITVLEGPNFDVTINSTTSPVTVGDVLYVNATVTNTGERGGTQDLELRIDNVTMDTLSETLDRGDSRNVSLWWDTEDGDGGTYTAEFLSEDGSDEVMVQVEPKNYNLTINVEGEGAVEVDGDEVTDPPYEKKHENGSQVQVNAVPDGGWQFEGWEGDMSGTDKMVNVTINGDTVITANFTEETSQGDDGGVISGFTSILLLSAVIGSAVIYYERKENR